MMIRDPFIAGGLAGLIGAFVKALINHLAFMAGWTNLSVLHLTQRLVYHTPRELTGATLFLSALVFVVFGSLFGVLLAYLYVLSGTDHRYIKGAAFGWLAYYLLENFLVPVVQPQLDLPYEDAAVAMNLATHVVYGLVAALVLDLIARLPLSRPTPE